MSKEMDQYGFSLEEWESCLKVLNALKDHPTNNPDNTTFKGLISKIKKNARKGLRKESYTEKKQHDLAISKASVISAKALQQETKFEEGEQEATHQFSTLKVPKSCYCCNQSFGQAHFFYNRICPTCAIENYEKRFASIGLSKRNVIITGARVKVGYATALKLLRNGANVVATTRFPALALQSYQQEKDYEQWKNRLVVYGLDLRDLPAVKAFIQYYQTHYSSLAILINNAAQTIQYPAEYYLPILKKEQALLNKLSSTQLIANETPIHQAVHLLETNAIPDLPNLELNRFGQPVDHREKTSWNSTLAEVSMQELLEVNLINHISPYYLIKELKSTFLASPFDKRFIINVSSSEGLFSYRNKTVFHPHTNMTKAALNMMTFTSGKEFAEEQIYMNCVDVGWISTGAKESLRQQQFEQGYIPPLDSVDGASRILDPIIRGINGDEKYGVLFKNYKISDW